MIRDVKLLLKLRLRGMFDINRARHGDESERKSLRGMLAVYAIVGFILCGYSAAVPFILNDLGVVRLVPQVFAFAVSSVMLLTRAGAELFGGSCDKLHCLPLGKYAIPLSRLIYIGILGIAFAALPTLPGAVSYVIITADVIGTLKMLAGIIILPLIPLSLVQLLGTLIYFIGSRLRRRNLWVTLFSIILVIAVLTLPLLASATAQPSDGGVAEFAENVMNSIASVYLPLKWFAGSVSEYLILILLSLTAYAASSAVICRIFYLVTDNLHAGVRESRTIKRRSRRGVLRSLLVRELKQYFSSSIYVLNTIIGPILAVIGAAVFAFSSPATLTGSTQIRISEGILPTICPFVFALLLTLAPTTASAVSIEGKSRWILQSLPITPTDIIKSKLAVNLIINLPGWVLSEAVLLIFAAPGGLDTVWTLAIPLAYLLLSSVTSLAINLKFRFYDWENAQQVVKQSKAVGFSLLASFVCCALPMSACAGLALLGVDSVRHIAMGVILAAVLLSAVLIYGKISKADFRDGF